MCNARIFCHPEYTSCAPLRLRSSPTRGLALDSWSWTQTSTSLNWKNRSLLFEGSGSGSRLLSSVKTRRNLAESNATGSTCAALDSDLTGLSCRGLYAQTTSPGSVPRCTKHVSLQWSCRVSAVQCMHVGQQAACGTAPRRLGLAIGFEDLLTFNHSGVPRFLPTLFACRAMRLRGRTNRRPSGGPVSSANSRFRYRLLENSLAAVPLDTSCSYAPPQEGFSSSDMRGSFLICPCRSDVNGSSL